MKVLDESVMTSLESINRNAKQGCKVMTYSNETGFGILLDNGGYFLDLNSMVPVIAIVAAVVVAWHIVNRLAK